MPRSFAAFFAGRVLAVRATVRISGQPWIVYLSKGMRYVLLRGSHRDRPWQCVRIYGRTDSWDCGSFAEKEDYAMAFLRRLQRPAQGTLDKPDPVDSELAAKFPALHAHLTATRGDDGGRRQTCSLTVYGHAGAFKGFLNDRDSGASLGVQAGSLAGLLGALEAELESDAPSWFWRQGADQGKGKKGGRGA